MAKITFIGAGSVVFCKNLLGDILSFPELAESEIVLMDIDPDRLAISEKLAHKVAAATGSAPTISATADRRRALDGADYVINMVQIGGFPSTRVDFDLPKKYGLRQTIADTLGIGGIFRSLRTIPMMVSMAREMEEVCPAVQFLNYVNPMCANTWAVSQATSIRTVGLCHSVQGTSRQLAGYMGIPYEELEYKVAGINHMAWFLKLEYQGQDAYPLLWEAYQKDDVRMKDAVRFEAFRRLGYFVTESSEHFSEYTPHFIRRDRPDLIERFKVPLDEYIRRCESNDSTWKKTREKMLGDEAVEVKPSVEYGSGIIHSMETGTPRVVYGNVLNRGLIDNLPQGCCVEVPCLVDKNGVQPTKIGALPPQLAAICQTNINPQSLTVAAALSGDKQYAYQAAMLDPHTAAELTLDEIWALCDDLFARHEQDGMLPAMDGSHPILQSYASDQLPAEVA
ncbi:MAG: alpha-glucosidase/alpha-galactosidase [Armatimonadetes bacterium]|nr:alpha-glucosidase/alpha-galactosidase [Armatimonadota bacterium]